MYACMTAHVCLYVRMHVSVCMYDCMCVYVYMYVCMNRGFCTANVKDPRNLNKCILTEAENGVKGIVTMFPTRPNDKHIMVR